MIPGTGQDPLDGPDPPRTFAQTTAAALGKPRGPAVVRNPSLCTGRGAHGGLGAGWGFCPSWEPPQLNTAVPHTHKDRSGPFLLWEPGLNAGVVPSVGPQSGRAGPVGVRAETIKRCFVCKPLDWGGCSLLGGEAACEAPLNTPARGFPQPWRCCRAEPPPHAAEHPRGLTGTLGGFFSPVPPIFLPEKCL